MHWPKILQHTLPLFLFIMIASIFANVGTALARPNILQGSPARNYEDPLDREKDPVHITNGSKPGFCLFRVHAVYGIEENGGTVQVMKGTLPANPADVVFGIGMNDLRDPDKVINKDYSFDNKPGMPQGTYNANDSYYEFEAPVPEGVDIRIYFPGMTKEAAARKGAWNKGAAPFYLFVVGWEASFPIYTEEPDGANNGYAIRRTGNVVRAIGTGRIATSIRN